MASEQLLLYINRDDFTSPQNFLECFQSSFSNEGRHTDGKETLCPTCRVSEAFWRLVGGWSSSWVDRCVSTSIIKEKEIRVKDKKNSYLTENNQLPL